MTKKGQFKLICDMFLPHHRITPREQRHKSIYQLQNTSYHICQQSVTNELNYEILEEEKLGQNLHYTNMLLENND